MRPLMLAALITAAAAPQAHAAPAFTCTQIGLSLPPVCLEGEWTDPSPSSWEASVNRAKVNAAVSYCDGRPHLTDCLRSLIGAGAPR